ncbi:nuclear transport factor 2 family protein [Pedobacter duraquae]|uniref:SnoaL-like protein n=1 Tax=Pedobacter duraquae TaxID=425511 RepID=A0A4R6IPI0_9SPHI|nr:nuclear transport factor 2 family protein [Pedobacter duraquae]TDO24190.1 hypothetical protein CLV32_0478 [Pedobacter duraquae]
MDSTFFTELQQTHVNAWNEKDSAKRIELLKKIYKDEIRMYDKDFIFEGLNAVSDFIGKLIAEDPAYHFAAAKPIEPLQNSARFYGNIQTSGGLLNSMDFFLFESGKVAHLYAYLEPAV